MKAQEQEYFWRESRVCASVVFSNFEFIDFLNFHMTRLSLQDHVFKKLYSELF